MSVDKITHENLVSWVSRLRFTLIVLTWLAVMVLIYLEVDSRIQLSQLKNAQHRIAVLEQQINQR